MKKIISTQHAPAAIGPYSQATQFGDLIFISGALPVDPKTGEVEHGGIKEQTNRSLSNIQAILEAAGCRMENVLKTTVFMQDLSQFTDMNEEYAKFFPTDTAPARATFQVAKLPKAVLIEIEAIAHQ